jgi:hypothetical protein
MPSKTARECAAIESGSPDFSACGDLRPVLTTGRLNRADAAARPFTGLLAAQQTAEAA